MDEELDLGSKTSINSRSKRQIERQFSASREDGVPIVLNEGSSAESEGGSSSGRENTEGLRIYDAWYQNSNSIPPASRSGRKVYFTLNILLLISPSDYSS